MRELKTKDIFAMSKILRKLDLKIETEGKTQEQLGAELILLIGENLGHAEKEINEFMGSLLDMTGEEFSNLPITDTLKYFEKFKNMPEVENFFKLAGQLTK